MKIMPGEKLVFIGDSITDSGCAKPQGEGFSGALGGGYVNLIDSLIASTYPHHKVRVINKGIGGQTVRDLKSRWQSDVIDLAPDWVTIMIGINDVWRHFDLHLQKEIHVSLAEYEATLTELVGAAKQVVKRDVILMTPFFIEANATDAMRREMDIFGAAVRRVARQHNTLFVDTQAVFGRLLESYWPGMLAGDRVHPSTIGHMALAKAWLNTVEFAW